MKRIFAVTLTLITVLATLIGCMTPDSPSESEGEQEQPGKRLSIIMTIAETAPSCVAFEYVDEKPYCFYAYDTDGDLYRVFWNDFTGLNENDAVVVDHTDDIRKLEYTEYPSGPTPRYEVTAKSVKKQNENLSHTGYEVGVTLYQYAWDGWGISTKTVGACDVAYSIIDALKAMKETGETVPKISDDVFEVGGGQYPIECGTMWIERSGIIYRLTPDLSQICLVETHFGEGKVLEITEEFKADVNNAWHYAPYDYYKGTYHKGDDTVELTSVFKSGSPVQMSVKSIKVEGGYDPHNTVTVELTALVDIKVDVKLRCQQSDDNMARGDAKTVELKKGVPATVELDFGGWGDSAYRIHIEADNTKAEITIYP